jgi:hypothetical protein
VHLFPPGAFPYSVDVSIRGCRVLNTTKCESEKLTAKLAAIAQTFAAISEMKYDNT